MIGKCFDFGEMAKSLGLRGRISKSHLSAHCPYHQDRNASFSLNVHTGYWHCWSCLTKGDFVQLVMDMEGYSLTQAEKWLVVNAVYEHALPLVYNSALIEAGTDGKPDWKIAYENLNTDEMPQWLFDRGFTWDAVNEWGMRWDAQNLRIQIPVYDHAETLVGTIGRTISSSILPKYKNSPDLPRSVLLFGFNRHTTKQEIILCEGVLDAVWLNQLGYPGVALMGTAMADGQLKLLQHFDIRQITLCMDNDAAGQIATDAHIDTLIGAGYRTSQIKCVLFPDGKKDIQECDSQLVKELISNAGPSLLTANVERKRIYERHQPNSTAARGLESTKSRRQWAKPKSFSQKWGYGFRPLS